MRLVLAERGLTVVPRELALAHASEVRELDLTENELKSGENLQLFSHLETLVLDKNKLTGLGDFPTLPSVTTLWCNNNNIEDLEALCTQIAKRFPRLRYLSLMRNPACPGFWSLEEETEVEYERFRFYVVYRLPHLKFLDGMPISAEEREQAKARGQYCLVRRPARRPATDAAATVPHASGLKAHDAGSAAASLEDTRAASDGRRRGPLASRSDSLMRYSGIPSEGNRYIGNEDL